MIWKKTNADDVLEFLKNEELNNQTTVLITTSMLTEVTNILNENITQIHYVDTKVLLPFVSLPAAQEIQKHEILFVLKKNETSEARTAYEKNLMIL